MKNFTKVYFGVLAIAAGMSCASCSKDNGYDLSNIDGTAKVSVNNLVVPININPIKLETVLNVGDDSKVKKETLPDGTVQYAIIESGTFTSSSINVPSSNITGQSLSSDKKTVDLHKVSSAKGSGITSSRSEVAYALTTEATVDLNFSSAALDDAIVTLDKIYFSEQNPLKITMNMNISGLNGYVGKIDLNDIKINFIKGITCTATGATYDNGVLTISNAQTNTSHVYTITVNVTEIDCDAAGITVDSYRQLHLNAQAKINSGGRISLYSDQVSSVTLPSKIGYQISDNVYSNNVYAFSGNINYAIKNIDVNPIDLTNIPEMLQSSNTSLILDNPQLRLDVNNPLREAGYSTNVKTGVSLQGSKNGISTGYDVCKTTDDAVIFDAEKNHKTLSPKDPQSTTYTWIPFPSLKNMLKGSSDGSGLPDNIDIDIINPRVQEYITKFRLGEYLNMVSGQWSFYAPLNLTSESKINYSKTWDSWQDEDLNYLTVANAVVTIEVTNGVPLNIKSIGFNLIGSNGNFLHGEVSTNIEYGKTEIVTISLAGNAISEISGASIKCEIDGGGDTLKPEHTITVKNVKACVNGYYQKKF